MVIGCLLVCVFVDIVVEFVPLNSSVHSEVYVGRYPPVRLFFEGM